MEKTASRPKQKLDAVHFPVQDLNEKDHHSVFGQDSYLLSVNSSGMCAQSLSCVRLFATLWTQPSRILCPWDSPDKNTVVGCHLLLQESFLTQGSNLHLLGLLHYQVGSGSIPESGRSPGEGNGNPLQYYSCLENFMDAGSRQGTVHGIAESDTTERLHFLFFFSLPLAPPQFRGAPTIQAKAPIPKFQESNECDIKTTEPLPSGKIHWRVKIF